MHDERSQETFNYLGKKDVIHSELAIPADAPGWVRELHTLHVTEPTLAAEKLWNRVEASEKRKDAQVARHIIMAVPRELTEQQQVDLVRDFVQEQLAGRGMVADWSLHREGAEDALKGNPHAHVMLTMRPLTRDGFAAKKVPILDEGTGVPLRDGRGKIRYTFGDHWGAKDVLTDLREQWEVLQNERLAIHGHEARVDRRSFKEQGISLVPSTHTGVHALSMAERGKESERVADAAAVRAENAARLIQQPEILFELLTAQRAVFTAREIERELARYVDEPETARQILARVHASPNLVVLGEDHRGVLYTSAEMLSVERQLIEDAEALAARPAHPVRHEQIEEAIAAADERLRQKDPALALSDEQRAAVRHMLGESDLVAVAGAAGAGKSTALGAARAAWEAAGFRVRGAALAGKAAAGLRQSAGIESRTLHSLEHAWGLGKELLTGKDVLIIDEAGMVGARQLQRVLAKAKEAGAKVVLVGDEKQLQPIEAGAPFRAIVDRIGFAELTQIIRQNAVWARNASMAFMRGDVSAALNTYRARGFVRTAPSRTEAKHELAGEWLERTGTIAQRIVLAYTNEDVRHLNDAIRLRRQALGTIGVGAEFRTAKGTREFSGGDRIVFLKNNRELEVTNGTLGTVVSATLGQVVVELDWEGAAEGKPRPAHVRRVTVHEAHYEAVDHGYAVTVHKAQGMTATHALVLASGGMDRHLSYVAMTRHRESATLFVGEDDFPDHKQLAQGLGRQRAKDSSLDYAERRGLETEKPFIENARAWLERQRANLLGFLSRMEGAVRRYLSPTFPAPALPSGEPTHDLGGALDQASRTAADLAALVNRRQVEERLTAAQKLREIEGLRRPDGPGKDPNEPQSSTGLGPGPGIKSPPDRDFGR